MIDNYEEAMALIDKMEAHLPIPAQPTGNLLRALREQGIKIKPTQKLLIEHLFYDDEASGITCGLGVVQEGNALVVSLTHLQVKLSHPLAKEIQKYQKERMRKLVRQDRRRY